MSIPMKKADYKSCTDNELVAFIVDKDNAAFVELMRRYKEKCINYLYRLVGDYEEAYDLSQEVFVKVFLYASRYNEDYKFTTWFFTITANIARDAIKSRIKRNTVSLEILDEAGEQSITALTDPADTPDVEYDKKYVSLQVQNALQSLPDHYREVLILKELQQFSFDEVAEILSIEVGTAKSRVSRGRAILKEKLKGLLIDFTTE
jgi:RNA polymerase sigma-70 factor (ECF subfamily)